MSDILFQSVKQSFDISKGKPLYILINNLKMCALGPQESVIVEHLISSMDNFKDNRGEIVEIIKYLILIVETVKGIKQGKYKKEQALEIFILILSYLEISQRDRKIYVGIFDNVVEMAFWSIPIIKEKCSSRGWLPCF